ncbi:MAG: restriction endonuclease [Candidatus Absconditabacteria bacterium]
MDIRKIALYLSGKIPPNYEKYNRLEFMELLKGIFGYGYDQLDFYWKQAKEYEEEFYFMVLDLLYSKSLKDENEKTKFSKLLEDLKLPSFILGVEEESGTPYTRDLFNEKLQSIYGDDPTNDDKGELFEELCKDILVADGFCNIKIAGRGGDGGIDITADKEILIGENTKKIISFIGQCKYKTSGNVTKQEVNDLISPIVSDSNNMYQGILFFTNRKYQPAAKAELEKTQSSRLNIKSFYLDGDEILDIINTNMQIQSKY